jgi:hypothetical protein
VLIFSVVMALPLRRRSWSRGLCLVERVGVFVDLRRFVVSLGMTIEYLQDEDGS